MPSNNLASLAEYSLRSSESEVEASESGIGMTSASALTANFEGLYTHTARHDLASQQVQQYSMNY